VLTREPPLGVAVLLAGILGFVQFGLFFGDLPGSGSLAPRACAAALVGAASGIALGRLRPAESVRLSLVATWGAALCGGMLGLMGADEWLAVLAVPAASTVLGGCAGAAWGRRRGAKPKPTPRSGVPPGSER
jgi:O-antigen/teichoic acid export membrane protein